MGFTLKVEGNTTIELGTTSITGVKVSTDIPFDATRQLGLWALVPAENSDCYRKVTVEVIAASQVVRKYSYPNAFVVDYKEDYGDVEGIGTFKLIMKQKKDKMAQVSVEGGYSIN